MGGIKGLNIVGEKYNSLTVIEQVSGAGIKTVCLCRCDCGNLVTCLSRSIRTGNTKSCGCIKGRLKTLHGHSRKGSTSIEYTTWRNMLSRCTNIKNPKYKYYGGRGITVDTLWLKFDNFLSDMGLKPNGMTLERIDNEKGYSKNNCKWASMSDQIRNRRRL